MLATEGHATASPYASLGRAQRRQLARALALGATPADDVHRCDAWRVLRDPEGNEFCIIRPKGAG